MTYLYQYSTISRLVKGEASLRDTQITFLIKLFPSPMAGGNNKIKRTVRPLLKSVFGGRGKPIPLYVLYLFPAGIQGIFVTEGECDGLGFCYGVLPILTD